MVVVSSREWLQSRLAMVVFQYFCNLLRTERSILLSEENRNSVSDEEQGFTLLLALLQVITVGLFTITKLVTHHLGRNSKTHHHDKNARVSNKYFHILPSLSKCRVLK